MCRSFTSFSGGLKPLMDTYFHACRCKVNQNPVNMLTKAKISSDVLDLEIASEIISQQQI